MGDSQRGQVAPSAAEVYESFFVPALFGQWSDVVLDAARVREGHAVLDVGCGTGVLARAACERVGGSGQVAAIDPNEGMLSLARESAPEVDWRSGLAERLPFAGESFDRTVSQFALMFFTEPEQAFREAARVTRSDGHVAMAVWDRLDRNAGYERLARLIEDLFGSRAADALRVPFRLGDPDTLTAIARNGLTEPSVTSHRGTARFDSLDAWLHTEIRGWTLADEFDDDAFGTLLTRARDDLSDLLGPDGVRFEVSALVVSGTPRLAA